MRKKRASEQTQPGKASLKTHEAHPWIRKWEEISGLHNATASEWGSWMALYTEAPAPGGTLPHSPPAPAPQEPPLSSLRKKNCSQMELMLAGLSGRCIQKKTLPHSGCLAEGLDLSTFEELHHVTSRAMFTWIFLPCRCRVRFMSL